MRTTLLIAGLVLAACSRAPRSALPNETTVPASSRELIAAMRQRYDGKWFRTLTFVQQTTLHRAGGTPTVSTWLEALEAPSRLRIDFGPPAAGDGVLYTADSSYRMKSGRVASASSEGNPLIPFVSALYMQPVDVTLAQLAAQHVDTTAFRRDRWRGMSVAIIGARTAADTTSTQGWVDLDRMVLVRMLLAPSSGDRGTIDIHLSGYEPAGGSLVATRLDMMIGADTVQKEEYSEIHIDMPLDPGLFRAETWSTARHWAGLRKGI